MQPEEKKPDQVSPVRQWDLVAYQLINEQLVPNGFKKIHNGKRTVSNIQFLSKKSVDNCKRLTAQLVREYRTRAKKSLQIRLATVEQKAKQAEEAFSNCKFWEIGKKGQLQKEYFHYRDQVGLLTILINELDNIEVK